MGFRSSLAHTIYIEGGGQTSTTEHGADNLHEPSSSTDVKTEPDDGRSELHKPCLEPIPVESQTIEQNAAPEIVPLSSFDIVKRHQEVPLSTRKHYERRNVSGGLPQRRLNRPRSQRELNAQSRAHPKPRWEPVQALRCPK